MTEEHQKNTRPEPLAPAPKPLTFWPLFWKASGLAVFFAICLLLLTALIGAGWGYAQFQKFVRAAGISQPAFLAELSTGWKSAPAQDDGHKNLLILGTDGVAGRGSVPELTDTMMLVSINTANGTVHTLPLPRDLWSDAYQTKINALYAYGHDRSPERPEQFPEEVLSELTGLPIHHTVVLSLEQLKTLIDLLGGVEITVETGFTDPLFPRSGVDVTVERDPAVLYETISFESGQQTLSGERALQYIRSRHSEDEQGHDLARGKRQQQVIAAIFQKLLNVKSLVLDPQLTANLYTFYTKNFAQSLPVGELVSTAHALLPHRKNIQFTSHELADIDDDPVNGVLENPPAQRRYQNQWVYTIADPDQFKATIHSKLYN